MEDVCFTSVILSLPYDVLVFPQPTKPFSKLSYTEPFQQISCDRPLVIPKYHSAIKTLSFLTVKQLRQEPGLTFALRRQEVDSVIKYNRFSFMWTKRREP